MSQRCLLSYCLCIILLGMANAGFTQRHVFNYRACCNADGTEALFNEGSFVVNVVLFSGDRKIPVKQDKNRIYRILASGYESERIEITLSELTWADPADNSIGQIRLKWDEMRKAMQPCEGQHFSWPGKGAKETGNTPQQQQISLKANEANTIRLKLQQNQGTCSFNLPFDVKARGINELQRVSPTTALRMNFQIYIDRDLWEDARYSGSVEQVCEYINAYPEGFHIADARAWLVQRDNSEWKKAQDLATAAAFQQYIDQTNVMEAMCSHFSAKHQDMALDEIAWTKVLAASSQGKKYELAQAYLKNYVSTGPIHAKEAREIQKPSGGVAPAKPSVSPEKTAWEKAVEMNTAEGYLDFMGQYPNSVYVPLAKEYYDKIRGLYLVNNLRNAERPRDFQVHVRYRFRRLEGLLIDSVYFRRNESTAETAISGEALDAITRRWEQDSLLFVRLPGDGMYRLLLSDTAWQKQIWVALDAATPPVKFVVKDLGDSISVQVMGGKPPYYLRLSGDRGLADFALGKALYERDGWFHYMLLKQNLPVEKAGYYEVWVMDSRRNEITRSAEQIYIEGPRGPLRWPWLLIPLVLLGAFLVYRNYEHF